MTSPAALLDREARSLVQRLRLWTPTRWAAAAPALGTRADVAHHLAQALADAAADAEGQPRRTVPRLDSALGLPDQVAVTAADLAAAGALDGVLRAAVAHLLLHRWHLLDDAVPASLTQALAVGDVLAAGQRACR